MLTRLATTLVGWGIPSKVAKPLVLLGLVLLAAGGFWGAKALYDRSVIDKHEQKLERRAAPATNKAADERASDAIANARKEQEMRDAIQAQPDQVISPTSHALACHRLRNAGKRSPACP